MQISIPVCVFVPLLYYAVMNSMLNDLRMNVSMEIRLISGGSKSSFAVSHGFVGEEGGERGGQLFELEDA